MVNTANQIINLLVDEMKILACLNIALLTLDPLVSEFFYAILAKICCSTFGEARRMHYNLDTFFL